MVVNWKNSAREVVAKNGPERMAVKDEMGQGHAWAVAATEKVAEEEEADA